MNVNNVLLEDVLNVSHNNGVKNVIKIILEILKGIAKLSICI